MLTAFNTAASALSADSTAVSIVGNNLANLNTTGFKANSVIFEDVFSEALSDGKTQVGLGVQTPLTERNFLQPGTTQTTSNPLDAAIVGQGFFVVKSAAGSQLYSRDGNFQYDRSGVLQNAEGESIQGWTADPKTGNIDTTGPIGNIVVPTGAVEPAKPSTAISFSNINLDATSTNYSTQVLVYDSLGQQHTLELDFNLTTPATASSGATWTWSAQLPNNDGTVASSSTGTLNFDQNGTLVTPTSSPNIQIASWGDGAQPSQNIGFDIISNGVAKITQFAQSSSSAALNADGSPATTVTGVAIGDAGIVNATLSNGSVRAIGQLAMANFVNADSLIAVGNNDFQVSGATSQVSIGAANTGGRGQIKGSALEASTVDISTEFTNLITFQNSYSANSRVITTANSMEQQTLNLVTPNG